MIKALKPFSVKVHDLEPSFSRWKPPKVNKLFLEVAKSLKPRRLRRVDKPSDQWIDPGQDTRAQRYQDQGYTWPLIEGTMTDGTAYEIARFVAAPDEVGVVKYCGTFIEVKSGDPAPDNYVVLDSKDPFAMSRHGVFGRFYMRLKQGTYYPLGPQWSGTYPEIYGYGYGPLPVWEPCQQTDLYKLQLVTRRMQIAATVHA